MSIVLSCHLFAIIPVGLSSVDQKVQNPRQPRQLFFSRLFLVSGMCQDCPAVQTKCKPSPRWTRTAPWEWPKRFLSGNYSLSQPFYPWEGKKGFELNVFKPWQIGTTATFLLSPQRLGIHLSWTSLSLYRILFVVQVPYLQTGIVVRLRKNPTSFLSITFIDGDLNFNMIQLIKTSFWLFFCGGGRQAVVKFRVKPFLWWQLFIIVHTYFNIYSNQWSESFMYEEKVFKCRVYWLQWINTPKTKVLARFTKSISDRMQASLSFKEYLFQQWSKLWFQISQIKGEY